jgi:hypothetical protein
MEVGEGAGVVTRTIDVVRSAEDEVVVPRTTVVVVRGPAALIVVRVAEAVVGPVDRGVDEVLG